MQSNGGLLFKIILILVCATLIASVGLLMRAAEDKEQSFDPTEATLYSETIKLTIAIIWTWSARPKLRPEQYELSIGAKGWLYFCPGSIGFVIVNNARFELVRLVNPGLLQVLWNLKVVVIGILYALPPFRKRLKPRQWLGAFLLVLGTTSAEISQSAYYNTHRNNDSIQDATGGTSGILLVAFLLVLTSVSAIATEYAYKNTNLPLCIQNIIMYQLGVSLNFFFRLMKCFLGYTACTAHQGFSFWTWSVVIFQALSGYTVGAIIKHIDCVAQVVADVLAVILSSWISFVFFDLRFSFAYSASLLLSLFALAVYYLPNSTIDSFTAHQSSSPALQQPAFLDKHTKHHDSTNSLLHDTDDREEESVHISQNTHVDNKATFSSFFSYFYHRAP